MDPEPEDVVLEVGTGSGYQAAILSELVRQVYSTEIVPELAQQAAERLERLGHANVQVRAADGYYGWAEQAPFDGIIVTAAAAYIPQPLIDRMEVLRLSGYIQEEKVEIAHRYLIPRQLKQAGLTEEQCDITDEASVKRLIESILEREGRIDILHNNVGVSLEVGDTNALDITKEAFELSFAVNLEGMWLTCKYALPALRESQGSIVNIASMAAVDSRRSSSSWRARSSIMPSGLMPSSSGL